MQQKSEASYKSHAGIERSKKEEQEYGPGKKDITMCKLCSAYYYSKAWHHDLNNYRHINENKDIKFTVCHACKMSKDNKFEGQVIFQNVPSQYVSQIISRIKNVGELATSRDPMDRIIEIKNQNSKFKNCEDIEVLTTENQLARNIARQVERAFKGLMTDTKWSKEESTTRIIVTIG